jgi:hypothetical protein
MFHAQIERSVRTGDWLLILVLLLLVGCVGAQSAVEGEAPALPASERVVDDVPPETAANADVIFVFAEETTPDTWTFHVTVSHPDTGWDDYADGWDVLLPTGEPVKQDAEDPFTRLLLHPHETEQPFTRSQTGLSIPAGTTAVTVRAHDLVDGFGGQEIVVQLAQSIETESYAVQRLTD